MSRAVTIAAAGAAAAVFLLPLVGCGSDEDAGQHTAPTSPTVEVDLVGPDVFAERMTDPGAVVINVHVPYEGEIAGTDLFVPFDEIAAAELPADRDRPLLVYCRTGNMSAAATADLVDAGYTNVTDLDGGMVAWEAADRSIEIAPDRIDTRR